MEAGAGDALPFGLKIPADPVLVMREGDTPVDDLYDPSFWAKGFPSLFPFGVGMFCGHPHVAHHRRRECNTCCRRETLSHRAWSRHCLRLCHGHFRHHRTFLFAAFNTGNRISTLMHTNIRIRSMREATAREIASITSTEIQRMIDVADKATGRIPHDAMRWSVETLLREVKAVGSKVKLFCCILPTSSYSVYMMIMWCL